MVSIRALTRFVSNGAIRVPTPKAHRATTGRLIKKIHGQLQLSLMVPPNIGPSIGAVVVVIAQIARPIPAFSLGDRKRVVQGKRVSVRVDLGGGRSIQKKKKNKD